MKQRQQQAPRERNHRTGAALIVAELNFIHSGRKHLYDGADLPAG